MGALLTVRSILKGAVPIAGEGGSFLLSGRDGFSALLKRHVRKEKRQLFVQFERRMPADEARKIGREIEARLLEACAKL